MALVGRIAHFAVEATTGATERGLSYRARDERTGDAVLLRAFPRHEFEGQGLERLRRVIAALEGAPRSALVNFSETWMDDSCTWIVRPFLEGPTLGDLPRHSITVDAAIDLTDAMAELLGAAHARGVVHGHVRPSNFVFADATRQSGLSVVDFGLTLDRQHAPTATDDWIGLGRVLYGMLGRREPDPRAPEVLRTLNPDVTPDLSSLVSDLLNGRVSGITQLRRGLERAASRRGPSQFEGLERRSTGAYPPPQSPSELEPDRGARGPEAAASPSVIHSPLAPVEAETPKATREGRVLNAWFTGEPPFPPLRAGRPYDFLFQIGAPRPQGQGVVVAFVEPDFGGHPSLSLLVSLFSEDFVIEVRQHDLVLPLTGETEVAKTRLTPRRGGLLRLEVVVSLARELDVLQQLFIEVWAEPAGPLALEAEAVNA
jgi:hypothetical protein